MEKTIKMNKMQQQLVRELLEQDIEFLQKDGIINADNENDCKGLIKCLEAEQDLLNQLGE